MKAHILVVDDDPRITDLMRRILAYEGYSVTIARSGTEALDRSLERPPARTATFIPALQAASPVAAWSEAACTPRP